MLRSQFDAVNKNIRNIKSGQKIIDLKIRVVVTKGKFAGLVGTVIQTYGSDLQIVFDDKGEDKSIFYTSLALLDDAGQPIIVPVTDMSGRVIEEGSVVVYSIAAGNNSHALQIARVIKLNDTGSVSVQPVIHNGERLSDRKRITIKPRIINDPDRSLVLPVDLSLVTMWLLSDWQNFKTES